MKSKLLYERALITCVLMLIVSIILKLFGVPWFNLDTSIPILNQIDEVVMNNYVLCMIYSSFLLTINIYMIVIITLNVGIKDSWKIVKYIFIFNMFYVCVKVYIPENIRILVDILYPIIYVIILNRGMTVRCFKRYITVLVLNLLYQYVSIFIRDISVHQGNYGFITSLLLMLDYYIMLVITYIYQMKGGLETCQTFRAYFSSLVTKLWRKPTQNSNQCSSKEN